jgi:hypothetical protein
MGVRLYSPDLGRFLQVDPVPGGSATTYDYCNADPINCTDLNGNFPWRKMFKAVAVVAAVAAVVACGASIVCAVVAGAIGAAAVYTASNAGTDHFSWTGLAHASAVGGLIGGVGGALGAAARAASILSRAASASGNAGTKIATSKTAVKVASTIWTWGGRAIRNRQTGQIAGRISKTGTRVFRSPAAKPYTDRLISNFERKGVSNYHVPIKRNRWLRW